MTVSLYHSWFSTCSQKVRLCLAEKNLPYESKVIDLRKQENLSEEYLAINPNGVVPSLKHDDKIITDSSVICEYLDEVYPENSLTPGSPYQRAKMRSWMRYFEEVPTAAIRVPSFSKLFADEFKKMEDSSFEKMTERMPLRKHFYQQMGTSGFSDKAFKQSEEKLRACLQRVESTLQDGRHFLLGDTLSLADIVLIPSAIRMIDLQMHHLWQDLHAFSFWLELVQSRPSFNEAFPDGCRFQLEEKT